MNLSAMPRIIASLNSARQCVEFQLLKPICGVGASSAAVCAAWAWNEVAATQNANATDRKIFNARFFIEVLRRKQTSPKHRVEHDQDRDHTDCTQIESARRMEADVVSADAVFRRHGRC